MPAPRSNLELKAKVDSLDSLRAAAEVVGATREAVLRQRDTYFRVAQGRLKLREIEGQTAELIWYERPDTLDVETSRYVISPVADAESMLAALSGSLGVLAVVAKTRELWMHHNVRIHLDQVEGLGEFLEFEAVLGPDADEETSRARLEQLRAALDVRKEQLRCESYLDLTTARTAR